MDSEYNEIIKKKSFNKIRYLLVFLVIIFLGVFLSSSIKEDKIIHISNNQTFNQIVQKLNDEDIINKPDLFKIISKGLNLKIKSGDYLFKKNSSFIGVVYQIATGDHKVTPVKITIREGLTTEKIADILDQKLDNFNRVIFQEKTAGKEGRLFPDTYFFFPLTTEEEIVNEFINTFNLKTKDLRKQISLSDKTLEEILTMASILEGEANGEKDNKVISGILWKRLSINMPLQVDVDRETYSQKGLPNKPLNNPGLSSIKAAINPEESSYLYYIHDKNGNVYYAKNYEEHRKNINLYLK
jgi:UPF0755 protein